MRQNLYELVGRLLMFTQTAGLQGIRDLAMECLIHFTHLHRWIAVFGCALTRAAYPIVPAARLPGRLNSKLGLLFIT